MPVVPSASERHDVWTPERQGRFILALAATGVVGQGAVLRRRRRQEPPALLHAVP